jgi:WD40 repeat protein
VLTESAPVSSLALSPDRTHFVTTGGSSGGVRMWDTGSLVQFGSDLAADATVWGNADFTSDGRSLVAMFGTHDLTVWPIGLQAWMAHACAVAGRNFTHEEWRRFVPGHAYSRTCPQFPAGS